MTSKARKPYLGLGKSLIEFFNAPVRYLKESNEKESAFEKPYLDGEYPTMHFDLPQPDWPSWDFGGDRDDREVVGTGPHCKGCDLSHYDIQAEDCPTDAVNIYSSSRCVHEAYGFRTPQTGKTKTGGFIQVWGDTTLTVNALVGEIVSIGPGRWANQHPDVDVYVNSDIEEHVLLATMVDDLGNVCHETVEVSCEACENVAYNDVLKTAYTRSGHINSGHDDWATCRDTGANLVPDSNRSTANVGSKHDSGMDENYDIWRGYWGHTLGLDAENLITDGYLILEGTYAAGNPNMMLYGSNYDHPLVDGDWTEFESTALLDSAFEGTAAQHTLQLNAAGIAWLNTNKTGDVRFCMREYDYDVADTAPNDGVTALWRYDCYSTDKPELYIDYDTCGG